jgi:hypothetical protein
MSAGASVVLPRVLARARCCHECWRECCQAVRRSCHTGRPRGVELRVATCDATLAKCASLSAVHVILVLRVRRSAPCTSFSSHVCVAQRRATPAYVAPRHTPRPGLTCVSLSAVQLRRTSRRATHLDPVSRVCRSAPCNSGVRRAAPHISSVRRAATQHISLSALWFDDYAAARTEASSANLVCLGLLVD